jgi:hypothetical protein
MMALQLESRLRVPHSHQSPANNIYKEDTAPNFNGSALLKCNSFTSSLPAKRLFNFGDKLQKSPHLPKLCPVCEVHIQKCNSPGFPRLSLLTEVPSGASVS